MLNCEFVLGQKMSFLGRTQEKRDRKERKTTPPSQPSSSGSAQLNRRPDSSIGGSSSNSPALSMDANSPPPDFDQAIDDNESEQGLNQQTAKRRQVSISRSGRFRTKNRNRTRILSEEIYSETPIQPTATETASSSPSPPPTTSTTTPNSSTILIKPSGRGKSPARPFIILQNDTAVNFAIESTTL